MWLIFVLDRHLDRLPERPSARSPRRSRSRCSSPPSASSCAAPPTRCAPAPPRAREQRPIDTVFSISSILTPFALGTMVGAIAGAARARRQRRREPALSWTGPTSILVGVLAVATSAYLAAVFLAADAARARRAASSERAFRAPRALAAGHRSPAPSRSPASSCCTPTRTRSITACCTATRSAALDRLGRSPGSRRSRWSRRERFEPARYSAALAVAAVIAGWALAQNPVLLRGLTVRRPPRRTTRSWWWSSPCSPAR